MKVAYIRVSTAEQVSSLNAQIEEMKSKGAEKIFKEMISGKNADRPQLKAMLEFVREGDSITVRDLSRLARNTKDLLEIVEILDKKGVALVSNREAIDTSTPSGKLLLTLLGAIAEFERTNQREKCLLGIEYAKAQGKYTGGHEKKIDDDLFNSLYEKYLNREISKSTLAKELNISRPTLDKKLKEKGLVA